MKKIIFCTALLSLFTLKVYAEPQICISDKEKIIEEYFRSGKKVEVVETSQASAVKIINNLFYINYENGEYRNKFEIIEKIGTSYFSIYTIENDSSSCSLQHGNVNRLGLLIVINCADGNSSESSEILTYDEKNGIKSLATFAGYSEIKSGKLEAKCYSDVPKELKKYKPSILTSSNSELKTLIFK